ncbi:nitrous oxide reductase family maturation protein NosD [Sediminibacterium soli]|uniref:nitrous oxide reductase family maturation protein NosD n=1 Tax=Sediminibacterium soli TaxID=2698829 RepID=UPI0013796A11|nr:nitrous oxide reductase family maturation protein NosD [Sediminibacterium soli]NCI46271.1 nitrous oxide reductase family maturation protein NosD [Sediminibacterium soli]
MYNRLILSAFFSVCAILAHAATRQVNPSAGLQQVLDKALPGDTIRIHPGNYRQSNIIVRKQLVIIGEGYPVFDGENKNEVFIIIADGVVLQGLQIQHTGRSSLVDMAGIKLQNVKNVRVTHCKLLNTTYGVYLQNSKRCIVSNNLIQASAKEELQSGNGVHAWKCEQLLISSNRMSGHRDGIYFEFVTRSAIIGNTSSGNIRYGLHFMFSHNDTYEYNTFQNNGAGVAVMYTRGVTMYKNTFYHNWGDASYGILLKDISDSKIDHNTFHTNTVGIYMEGSSRIHVTGNTFSNNGWAMRIQASCDGNLFEKNNFSGNSFDVATNGTMMLNTFRENYWDKYDGYDLDRDGTGDVPYYPVSVYSVITERIPVAMILYRSFLTRIMDQVENIMPSITPDQLKDIRPRIKKWQL